MRLFEERLESEPIPGDESTPPATSVWARHPDQWLIKRFLARRRCLRARKLDVNAAYEQYNKILAWRIADRVDSIFDEDDPCEPVFQTLCSHRHFGFDKLGHPVYWEKTGYVRVSQLLAAGVTEDDIVRRHVRSMEYAVQRCEFSSARNGRNIEQFIVIQDLDGLSMKVEAPALRVFKRCAQIDRDYYPERLHRLVMLNAPIYFRTIWALIKMFVDPKTAQKISILSAANSQAQLQAWMDMNELPFEYGGHKRVRCRNGDAVMPMIRAWPDPEHSGPWPAIRIAAPLPLEGEANVDCGVDVALDAPIESNKTPTAANASQGFMGRLFGWGRK
jgi:hypothetical protein